MSNPRDAHFSVDMRKVGLNPKCQACYETFARALWQAWHAFRSTPKAAR